MCRSRSCAHYTECLVCQLKLVCFPNRRAALPYSAYIYISVSALFWKSHFKRLCEMDVAILNWARSCIKIACYKLSRHTFLPFLPLFLFHSSSLSEREEIYVPSRHNKKRKSGEGWKNLSGTHFVVLLHISSFGVHESNHYWSSLHTSQTDRNAVFFKAFQETTQNH